MPFKPLAPGISVSSQISSADIAAAAAQGIRTIINSRPDHEEPGQPTSAELEAQARAAGLDYRHVPVIPGRYGDAEITAFRDAIGGCEGPALAFCKSGMRAASLWALAQAGELPTDAILRAAAGCGYDLTPLLPRIEARARDRG